MKKTALVCMIAAMVFALLSVTAFAEDPESDPVARVGEKSYTSLYDALKAAINLDEFNGKPVDAENLVVVEVLQDTTLEKTVSRGFYDPADWFIKLTSAGDERYTVTRGENLTGSLIQLDRNSNGVLVLENIVLDGGATSDSQPTDSILLTYGTVYLNNGAVLQNNNSKYEGGAINHQGGTLIMNDGAIIQNNVSSSTGGGVSCYGLFQMNGGLITENRSTGNSTYGGGVSVSFLDGACFEMTGGEISNNYAYNGGGIYFSHSTAEAARKPKVVITGGTIKGNSSKYEDHDEIYTQFSSLLVLGGDVKIDGTVIFSSAAATLQLTSPLANPINLKISLTPGTDHYGKAIVTKGDTYEGDLDLSKIVFTGDNTQICCLYLSEDASEITINRHSGGTAGCTAQAVCENCGTPYGSKNSGNHIHPVKVPEKAPTVISTGNIEYWYCADCGQYFADAGLTQKINPSDVVIARLPRPLDTEYYLNFVLDGNGSVTPGSGMYEIGSTQTFTITPDSGYEVDQVLVDGKAVYVHNNQFTLTVDAPYRITVQFAEKAAEEPGIDVSAPGSGSTTATPNPQTGASLPVGMLAALTLAAGSLIVLRKRVK